MQQDKPKVISFTAEGLKLAIKNATDPTLRLSAIVTGDDETNFPHRILLIASEVSSLQNDFTRKSLADIKSSTITIQLQLSKIIESGGFLGRLDH